MYISGTALFLIILFIVSPLARSIMIIGSAIAGICYVLFWIGVFIVSLF